jgi:Uma2 family endonuclease
MTPLPADSWLLGIRPQPQQVTAEKYEMLPEEIARAIEIVSPGSETQDTTGKPGEYAKAGIPHYRIVRLGNTGVSVIERYQVDRATMLYKHVGTFMKDEVCDAPAVSNPIPITIDWAELQF